MPLKMVRASADTALLSASATCISIPGWKTKAMSVARRAEIKSTMSEGTFLYIITPVATGTRRSHGVTVNVFSRAATYCDVSLIVSEPIHNPASEKMMSVMKTVGPVVSIMYLMCVKSGVPLTEEASTVVSLRGDTLSPKYAPEMMAPAVHPSSKPNALPMPSNASPMVAIVVHDEPVMREMTALMTQAEARNTAGWMICMP